MHNFSSQDKSKLFPSKGEYHGSAHALAIVNVNICKPIGSNVTTIFINAGNLHVH